MKRRRPNRLNMTLLFSSFVCGIFLITTMIIGIISFILNQLGVPGLLGNLTRPGMVLVVLVSCVLVGTLVSFALSRIPLKPIRRLINMTNELAAGDFDVRLEIDRPPELQELAESFNRMAQELGSIEMLRSDFVNNFSHEFKTPIVSIKGFAEMLKYGDLTEAERDEYLDIVINESARLAELSNNVLYLSKIENQGILTDAEPFQLGEQIRHCILLLQTKWEGKGLSLVLDLEDLVCVGNEEMLSQVWTNLLDNAIKFSPEGGTVSVRLRAQDDKVLFELQDEGCGIQGDALPRIFDRFYQADTSHTTQGNGLGLTLVKKIVTLHGGSITCENAPEQGARFTVTLPLAQA